MSDVEKFNGMLGPLPAWLCISSSGHFVRFSAKDEAERMADELNRQHRHLAVKITYKAVLVGDVEEERKRWKAAMTLPHLYGGDCPDQHQPHARDPKCQACRALVELEAEVTGPWPQQDQHGAGQ